MRLYEIFRSVPGEARRVCICALLLLCSCKSLSVYQQVLIPPFASTYTAETDRQTDTGIPLRCPQTDVIRHDSSRRSDFAVRECTVPGNELGIDRGSLEAGEASLLAGCELAFLWNPSSLVSFLCFFPWLHNSKSSTTFN